MRRSPRPLAGPAAVTLAVLLFTALAACGSDAPAPTQTAGPASPATAATAAATPLPSPPPPAGAESMAILTAAGTTVTLSAEIAETPEQRSTGLMGRDQLAPDSGMLFVIAPPGRGFWMRGTTIPLTVAFIARCGEIVDFADMQPLSEEIKNTQKPYAFALEMAQGWFAENGIAAGDTLSLPPRLLPSGC